MITARKLAAFMLIAPLLLGSATATFAQTPGGGTTGTATTANRDDDRDTDWSWLGLLGLLGLAGLIPQKRSHDARGTTTTR
jgi:hypothetical protein